MYLAPRLLMFTTLSHRVLICTIKLFAILSNILQNEPALANCFPFAEGQTRRVQPTATVLFVESQRPRRHWRQITSLWLAKMLPLIPHHMTVQEVLFLDDTVRFHH